MSDLADLCEARGVTLDALAGENEKPCTWEGADGWRVTLHYQGRDLSCDFFTGRTIIRPETADVVASLILDAQAGAESFADFCGNFGYDEDSRKAYATWEACVAAGPKIRELLGEDFDLFASAEH